MSKPYIFSHAVIQDICGLLLGDRLGAGVAREVFVYGLDESKVIKIEDVARSFQNVMEWEVWKEIEDTEWARWFAPCHFISPSGSVLIQARTKPIERLPAELPSFLADLKPSNFGRYKGRIVAHDYGLNMLMTRGLSRVRMRKVSQRSWRTQ